MSNNNVEWLDQANQKFESCAYGCTCKGSVRCSLDGYPVLDCPNCNSYKQKGSK